MLSLLFGRDDIFTTMFTARMSMVNYSGVSLPAAGGLNLNIEIVLMRTRSKENTFYENPFYSRREPRPGWAPDPLMVAETQTPGVGQERLGPSYLFISLVLGPLNSLLWYVPS